MSLAQGRERLLLAAKQLMADWQALKETWRDENCRKFEQTYIQILETQIRDALVAMDRADAATHNAHQDCRDREGFDR